jgi:hypothetical protein
VVRVDDVDRMWRERPPRCVAECGELDPLEWVGHEAPERLLRTDEARQAAVGAAHERRQRTCCVLERLALEQARKQQVALLEPQQLLVELEVRWSGEQAPRLQLDEGRRDEEELRRDLEVERLHRLELGEVLVDDRRERHLPEIDLLTQDQVQQEVERTLEGRRPDLVPHRISPYKPAAAALPTVAGGAERSESDQ